MLSKRRLTTITALFSIALSQNCVLGVNATEAPHALSVSQQVSKIKGNVVDSNGEPIIGATIMEKGTTNGTVTDLDGNFVLNVAPGAIIQISYIGFATQELKASDNLRIKLKEDTEVLDEVVVVGFGTQKKVNLTGSVSVVDEEELRNRPVTNATQALQGVVPGLQITQSSGDLNNAPSMNIRGTSTIGQGSSGTPLVLIDGMEGDLNSLNPQDIASISVLKDAAASSIYGSRAPFGVILVTTKSGSTGGKTRFNYNNSFRWATPIRMTRSMNSVDFGSWVNDGNTNSGGGIFFSKDRMDQIVAFRNAKPYGPGTRITDDGTILYGIAAGENGYWLDGFGYGIDDVDWFSTIFKTWTFSQEHNFSVSGGNEKLNYYVSLNYLGQGGLMNLADDGLDRYNGTAKISSQITNWMKMNYTMRFTREDYLRPTGLNDALYDAMGWPVLSLYDANGYYYSTPAPALGIAEGGESTRQTDNIYHQLGFVIEPIKNWKTHIDLNYRIKNENQHVDRQMLYNHDVKGNPYVYDKTSYVSESNLKENYFNVNIYSDYTFSVNDVHNMHVMAGFQAENLNQKYYSLQRNGIMFTNKPDADLTTGLDYDGNPITPSVRGYRNSWSTAGFFGRFNYNYNDKYLFEANLRYDGTSRFQKGNQWKLFPSFSLGWNIAREEFFESLSSTIGTLKLRGSYGTLGNQNTTNWYQTYQTMSVGSADGDWMMNGRRPNTAVAPGLVSPFLTWETIESYNIALDWGLLSNRLTGSVEYYIRNTKNMIGNAPELPSILGTAVPVTNNTDLRTKGWEVSIGWNDMINDFSYGAKFNLSDARTFITRYPNNPTKSISTYIEGREINEIWGYTTKGLARTDEQMAEHLQSLPNGGQDALGSDWRAGDVMYADVNGDGKISSGSGRLGDTGDITLIGNSTPRFLFGLDLYASWKGFDIRMFFQGVMKRDYWQGSGYLFGANSRGMWNSFGIEEVHDYFRDENTWSVKEGYQTANVDAYLPRPLYNDKNVQTQTGYLQNAAYIRLKNMQIGYTLPKSVVSKIGIQDLRIYFSGENLWTGTSLAKQFDPETISSGVGGIGYPLSRTLSCGLNVSF
ncbi:TonB-dependent receptor [Phocaeicola plebeius]|uniref:SusC/RagA family TonB-linked outer membrane protein n=1 Tax=Phocaeicola plebeius TaxID=310297 RepID=UPI0026EA17D1|nr:TonB-dependent receptor [Phocaeicola plebeius]